MKRNERLRALLVLLAIVIGAKVGQQLYRWFAFREERARLEVLRDQVVDAGVEVVRTEALADTFRLKIERADRELEAYLSLIERYGHYSSRGTLPGYLYDSYTRDLTTYNQRVVTRNQELDEWKKIREQNGEAVDRYNLLSDSIRVLGARIGDPYYPVPLPVEAAVERGVLPGSPPP